MTDRIVFLNLADMDPAGLAKTSARNLTRKFAPKTCFQRIKQCILGGTVVDIVNLFDLLNDRRIARDISQHWADRMACAMSYDLQRVQIREACRSAKKIMLGAHGTAENTERVKKSLGWGQGSGDASTYAELAEMTADFLYEDQTYKLSLIICYAARSEAYRKNHDGTLSKEDVQSSLAYKFYKTLCAQTRANVVMTARTGEVQFMGNGASFVNTEEGVNAVLDLNELSNEFDVNKLISDYNSLRNEYIKAGKTSQFEDISNKASSSDFKAQTNEDRILKNGQKYINAFEKRQDLTFIQPKYGKFVYRRLLDGTVSVVRKYPEPTVLYEGVF